MYKIQQYNFTNGETNLSFQFPETKNLLENKISFIECLKAAQKELMEEVTILLNKKPNNKTNEKVKK